MLPPLPPFVEGVERLRGKAVKDFSAWWFVGTLAVAMVFSLNGGYINAVCFTGVWRTGLTHLTGSTTNSAIRVVNTPKVGQFRAVDLMLFVFFFGFGAFVAGFIIGPARLRWGGRQGLCWTIFGLAMAVGWYLSPHPDDLHLGVPGGCAVSMAMGIQNTVTSLFTPLTIRSSHISGTNYLAFWVGAVVGTVGYNHFGHDALLVNVVFGLSVGLGTIAVLFVWHPKEKKLEPEIVMESTLEEAEHQELVSRPGDSLIRRPSAK